MGTTYLSIELTFDLIALTMGAILIFQAKDNYQRLYWGIIAFAIGCSDVVGKYWMANDSH